jgi:hypothetical protein
MSHPDWKSNFSKVILIIGKVGMNLRGMLFNDSKPGDERY